MTDQDAGPIKKAEHWLDDKTKPVDNRVKHMEDVEGAPTVADLRREQRREIADADFVGTEGQRHGVIWGGLAFGLVGLVAGVLLGLVAFDGDSPGRVVLPTVVTAFGAWVGIVYWGGRTPELENETMTATGIPSSSSTLRDPDSDARGR